MEGDEVRQTVSAVLGRNVPADRNDNGTSRVVTLTRVKKRLAILLAVIVLLATTLVAYYRGSRGEEKPAFAMARVTRGDVVETGDATGTLKAVTTVQVGTQVSGTIKALHVDFNSIVRGQVIAELEPSLLNAQVEQARASIVRLKAEARRATVQSEDAQQKLKRARELSQRELIPTTDLETAEANARQAEAAVEAAEAQIVQAQASLNQAEVNLDHTIITAPIDGIVISRNVDVGQTVAASMQTPTLFVIARDLTKMQVNASVAESDIGRIQPGQAVSFRVDAYPTDATHTAILAGPVTEGLDVVTAITMQTSATPSPSTTSSPLIPPRRPPPAGRGTSRQRTR